MKDLWGDSFTLRKAESFKDKKSNWYAASIVKLLFVVVLGGVLISRLLT